MGQQDWLLHTTFEQGKNTTGPAAGRHRLQVVRVGGRGS
jgi:hypothetical protein